MAPKHKKFIILAENLRDDLKTPGWKAGQRFYSENQLSQKYEVSRQTVRQAIALLEEEDLLLTRRGSGTYVTEKAVSSRNYQSRTIGILVTYLSDYIFPVIIKELEKVFTAADYSVYIASTGNSVSQERKLLQAMIERKVDGIILEPTKSALPNPNLDLYKDLQNQGYPIICINSYYPSLNLPLVALNDEKAGYIATKYLIEAGHTKLGAVLKSDDIQGHLRYSGFQKAIIEHHAELMDERVFWYTTEDLSDLEDDADHILKRLKGCTAVLCYNDQIALRVMTVLNEAGFQVPDDISIISIDDSRFAGIGSVLLTSVRNPASEIGRIAAENLLRLVAGQNINAGRIFEPQLSERKSVQAITTASNET